MVRSAAATQGVIDAFVVIGGLTALALLIVVAHRRAPRSGRPRTGRCSRGRALPQPASGRA